MSHTHPSARKRTAPFNLIRWEFIRDGDLASCRVDRDPASGVFTVGFVSTCRGLRMSVETFQKAGAALVRHAALTSSLRASGWTHAGYTA